MTKRFVASKGVSLLTGVYVSLLACASNPVRDPAATLRMGMTPQQVIAVGSDTPCKVATQFHGNPAEAWGYQTNEDSDAGSLKPSSCERANYWIYFEMGRVVGWTKKP